jgi:hypothetical protein
MLVSPISIGGYFVVTLGSPFYSALHHHSQSTNLHDSQRCYQACVVVLLLPTLGSFRMCFPDLLPLPPLCRLMCYGQRQLVKGVPKTLPSSLGYSPFFHLLYIYSRLHSPLLYGLLPFPLLFCVRFVCCVLCAGSLQGFHLSRSRRLCRSIPMYCNPLCYQSSVSTLSDSASKVA